MNVKMIRKLKKISTNHIFVNSNSNIHAKSHANSKSSYMNECNNKQNYSAITKKHFVRLKYSDRHLIFTIPKNILQYINDNMIDVLKIVTYTYGDVLHYKSLQTLLHKIYIHHLKQDKSKMFDFIKIINIIALYYYEYDIQSNIMKQLDSFTRCLFRL